MPLKRFTGTLHEYGLDLESFNYMLSYTLEPRCTWTPDSLMIMRGRQTVFQGRQRTCRHVYDELVDNEEYRARNGVPSRHSAEHGE